MDKSELFRKAHKMTKAVIAKLGGNYRVTFGCALSTLWKEAIEEEVKHVGYQVKDWFYKKNIDNFVTAHCYACRYFSNEDIIKETEKAYQVKLDLVTNAGAETAYTKLVWVPKACVETYTY